MKSLSCYFVSGVGIILSLRIWIAAFPIAGMLIITLSYVDSVVSNTECGFNPSISLKINTDAFLLRIIECFGLAYYLLACFLLGT